MGSIIHILAALALGGPALVRTQAPSWEDFHRESLACLAQGRYDFERALAIQEKRLGSNHPALAPLLLELAEAYRSLHRTRDAAAAEQRAQRIQAARRP